MAHITDIALIGGLVLLGGGILKGLDMFKVPDLVGGVTDFIAKGGKTTYTDSGTGLSQGSTYIKDFFRSIGFVDDFSGYNRQTPAVGEFETDIAILGKEIQLADTEKAKLIAKINYQKSLNEMWSGYINDPTSYAIDYGVQSHDTQHMIAAMNSFRSNLITGTEGVALWERELLSLG